MNSSTPYTFLKQTPLPHTLQLIHHDMSIHHTTHVCIPHTPRTLLTLTILLLATIPLTLWAQTVSPLGLLVWSESRRRTLLQSTPLVLNSRHLDLLIIEGAKKFRSPSTSVTSTSINVMEVSVQTVAWTGRSKSSDTFVQRPWKKTSTVLQKIRIQWKSDPRASLFPQRRTLKGRKQPRQLFPNT